MPFKNSPTGKVLPGQTNSVDSQRQITLQAAQKWNVSPQTLWGVYGIESSFGTNEGHDPNGAQGPMAFEPATWAKYGGGQNIFNFAAAMPAAAHLLHDLGANTNPTSPQTFRALNSYNGNGDGSSQGPYVAAVLKFGGQLHVSGDNSVGGATGVTSGSGGSGGGGGGTSLLDILGELVNGDIADLAASVAMMFATGIKDMAVGFADLVIVPVWHRNQRAVWYYTTEILFPTKGSQYRAWQTWPANAAFWGFGYGLLFTDPTTGSWKPVPPRQSRIARHVRRGQAAPAHRSLVKPAQVKEKTPPKPKPRTSHAPVAQVDSLFTRRNNRPVRVQGEPNGRQSERSPRTRPEPEPVSPVISEVQVKRDKEITTTPGSKAAFSTATKSYPHYPGRLRPHSDSHMAPKSPPKASERVRDAARHRGTTGHRKPHK